MHYSLSNNPWDIVLNISRSLKHNNKLIQQNKTSLLVFRKCKEDRDESLHQLIWNNWTQSCSYCKAKYRVCSFCGLVKVLLSKFWHSCIHSSKP
jgi:hypothetical protein